MLRTEARARAIRGSDHERQRDLAVRHVARLGDLVRDDVPAHREKIREHNLCDRAQTRHRSAHRRAENRLLGDRTVAHTLGTEFFEQAHGRLEHAARRCDIFAQKNDTLVTRHLLRDTRGNRVTIRQFRHDAPPFAQTSFSITTRPGTGEVFAASVASFTFFIASLSSSLSVASAKPTWSRRLRYISRGSRFNHCSSSPSGRYFAGSARECPLCRYVIASISAGPPPSRARVMYF